MKVRVRVKVKVRMRVRVRCGECGECEESGGVVRWEERARVYCALAELADGGFGRGHMAGWPDAGRPSMSG